MVRRNSRFSDVIRLAFLGLVFALLQSCSSDVASVPETEYSARIVGEWLGTVGDTRETISFGGDGTFVSQVRSRGFISNTLGQGVTGTIRGKWAINGKVITLNVTGAEDARLLNTSTTSTIESFKPNDLVVKSQRGDTSTFVHAPR
jgi:hypothetical protein